MTPPFSLHLHLLLLLSPLRLSSFPLPHRVRRRRLVHSLWRAEDDAAKGRRSPDASGLTPRVRHSAEERGEAKNTSLV